MGQGTHILNVNVLNIIHVRNRLGQHTLVNQRMMIGKKKLKKPDTAGGNTPDAMANVLGDASAHESSKGT
jgi:hypothetical protein